MLLLTGYSETCPFHMVHHSLTCTHILSLYATQHNSIQCLYIFNPSISKFTSTTNQTIHQNASHLLPLHQLPLHRHRFGNWTTSVRSTSHISQSDIHHVKRLHLNDDHHVVSCDSRPSVAVPYLHPASMSFSPLHCLLAHSPSLHPALSFSDPATHHLC
jgi:hypothetical protein